MPLALIATPLANSISPTQRMSGALRYIGRSTKTVPTMLWPVRVANRSKTCSRCGTLPQMMVRIDDRRAG
jgi:hypothetical protein